MPSYTSPKAKTQAADNRRNSVAQHYRDLPLIERRRRNKEAKLRRNYGLTLEKFAALLVAQGHRCPGCGTDTPGGRGWNIHHSHRTGRVLAVLCHLCNRASGMLGDDPVRLRRLADINDE